MKKFSQPFTTSCGHTVCQRQTFEKNITVSPGDIAPSDILFWMFYNVAVPTWHCGYT